MAVNYHQVIRESRQELAQNLQARDRLDQRIAELCIALRALVRFIPEEAQREQILQEVKAARRKQPSLADAIVEVLSKSKDGLNGPQIREQLEQSGFDIEDYSQPLGAVMTAAQRLVEARKLTKHTTEESGVVFKLARTLGELLRTDK